MDALPVFSNRDPLHHHMYAGPAVLADLPVFIEDMSTTI
jgi:hypothetical protein